MDNMKSAIIKHNARILSKAIPKAAALTAGKIMNAR